MTDQEILTRAVEKAIAGGWGEFYKDLNIDAIVYDMGGEYELIFNHDFAKALWGKGNTFRHKDGGLVTIENPNYWKAKLRSMVVAKDPIKYLGEHI